MKEHRLRVFENRVLKETFRPKKNIIIGNWRKLPNEKLHNMYLPQNLLRMIKSRRTRLYGHVARVGEMWNS
jgi:hypothetical protein